MFPVFCAALFLASCRERPDEAGISETRPLAAIDSSPRLDVTSAERLGGQKPPPFLYVVPEGWKELPPTRYRRLNFRFGTRGQAYLSEVGGGLLPNTNRWLGQFGKPPLSEEGLKLLPIVEFCGGRGIFVRAEGRFTGGIGLPPADDWSLLGVITPMGERFLTLKMIGPKNEVAAARSQLLELCRTLRYRRR